MTAPSTPHDPPDADLVRLVRAGNAEAFAPLVRRHERAVWGVAVALCTDDAAAEALVQQTFVRAYERLGQFDLDRDVASWLKAIARNLARDELRRRSRETHALSSYRQHLEILFGDDDRAEARQRQLARALAKCRGRLPATASHAIALYYEQGLTLESVAAALGRTLGATRQLLMRTRTALRLCVSRSMPR